MKFQLKRKTGIYLSVIALVAILFVGFSRDEKNFEIAKNLDIYYTLFRELNLVYVDDVEPAKLVKNSIDKMLETLDPYTTYIPESEIEDFQFMTTGDYAGIGAVIGQREGNVIVTQPYEGFPAQKAGLKAGDIFLEVEGKSTEDMTSAQVSELLRGAASRPLTVKMKRPGVKKPIEITLVREKIHIPAVPYSGMLDEKIGYIRFTNFTVNCSDDVKSAFLELKEKYGAEAIILDLRGNPGGLLFEAVKTSNLFVPKGEEIVSTRGKVKQWDQTYHASAEPVDTVIPLVVIASRGSASAAEIVAGSIQDLDRGVIMGTRTFGKGLVQATRDLSYNAKLKITTAKYYIPSGRCIQALDYTNRNEDGSVGEIPDSLISEFTTRNKRKVFDGGGIQPDVEIKPDRLSNLAINLIGKFMIFDYATAFQQQHKTIAPPETFEITDDVFAEFKKFVTEKEFTYESFSEGLLDELMETAKKEKYYDSSKHELDILKKKLEPNLDKDLVEFEDEIRELLKNEIVSRYYYQKGEIISIINDDKTIKEAIALLNDKARYDAILNPQKGQWSMKNEVETQDKEVYFGGRPFIRGLISS